MSSLPPNQAIKQLAYQLADSLRKQYTDKGNKIPEMARLRALQQLQQVGLTLEQAETALAQGFFESR